MSVLGITVGAMLSDIVGYRLLVLKEPTSTEIWQEKITPLT